MITTLIILAVICTLSLGFVLVIPSFAATKAFMSFLPVDIRKRLCTVPEIMDSLSDLVSGRYDVPAKAMAEKNRHENGIEQ